MNDLDIEVIIYDDIILINKASTVVRRSEMIDVLKDLKRRFNVKAIEKRSNSGLAFEWMSHNNLKKLGFVSDCVSFRSKNRWYYSLACFLMGLIRL